MLLKLENFLTAEECGRLHEIEASGTFADGIKTARMPKDVKVNEQLEPTERQREEIRAMLLGACQRSPAMMAFAQPKEMTVPLLSRYRPGMKYGRHLDVALMGRGRHLRSDLSMTVFLADPDSYDGGALVLDTDYGKTEVKLPAGSAVCYSTLVYHEVQEVTRGERLALVTWFHSRIRDPIQRGLLFDVTMARNEVMTSMPESAAAERLQKTAINMTRLWSEP